jgi:hypothetical protein
MGFLIIIIVLVVLWAHKSGRPMKLVLTPEEAKAVRAKWWAAARVELKVWAICFAVGYAVAGQSLASAHWHWSIFAMIVLGSLQLFSRLAIWGTFALWVVALVVTSIPELIGHHPLFNPLYIMVPLMGAIIAILVRFFFMFWKPEPVGSKPPSEQKGSLTAPSSDDRVYDYETDTYVYKEGNREAAHIRWPRDEDRPENVRRQRDEDDYFERKRADDDYFDQLRRRRE